MLGALIVQIDVQPSYLLQPLANLESSCLFKPLGRQAVRKSSLIHLASLINLDLSLICAIMFMLSDSKPIGVF